MPYVGKKPADIIATSVDTDTGAFSGNVTAGGTLGVTGAVTANAGVVVDNITIDGTEIDLSSGDFTLDVAGEIVLDADGGNFFFNDGGTSIGRLRNVSSDFVISSEVQDKDLIFKGNDNGSTITALTLDMSEAGRATFNDVIRIPTNLEHDGDADTFFGFPGANNFVITAGNVSRVYGSASETVINEDSADLDFRVEGNGDTHALSLQASDDRVAVGGTGTYTGKFTVNSAINNNGACTINANASDFSSSVIDLNTLRNTTDGTYFFLSASISGIQTKVRVQDSGNFLNVNNSYGALSDEKLKENIADASSQWNDIKAIKVRKYSMKEDKLSSANRIGVVAQELETAGLNNLVEEIQEEKRDTNEFLEDGKTPNPYYWQIIGKEETTTKAVKYSVLYMKAVKALQEAMARIETLEASNTALEARITTLESA